MAITKSGIIDSAATEYQFISLRNAVRLLGQIVQDISRPGVDGHAWRKTGKRGQPFEMVGIRDFTTLNDSDSYDASMRDLRGTFVQLYTDFGTHHTNVMVLDSIREVNMPALAHVGGVSGASAGSAVVLAHFRLTLVHTAVP